MNFKGKSIKLNAKVGRGFAATLILSTTLGGGITGVGMQSMGAWPKWLGGSYVSQVGCDCKDLTENGINHWVTCPVKNLWGLNNTGSWSTPEIHGGTCHNHGH